jgi:hypothetical protein
MHSMFSSLGSYDVQFARNLMQYSDWLQTGHLGFDSHQKHEHFAYQLSGPPLMVKVGSVPMGKGAKHEAHLSLLYSAEVTNAWSYTFISHTSSC